MRKKVGLIISVTIIGIAVVFSIGMYIKHFSIGGGMTTAEKTIKFLNQLKDVIISSPTNGQPLAYDSAQGQWTNTSTITISSITTSFPDKSVIYSNSGALTGSSNLLWFNTSGYMDLGNGSVTSSVGYRGLTVGKQTGFNVGKFYIDNTTQDVYASSSLIVFSTTTLKEQGTASLGGTTFNSGALEQVGSAWDVDDAIARKTWWKRFVIPTSANAPSGKLSWQYQLDNGGYTEKMNLSSTGVLTAINLVNANNGTLQMGYQNAGTGSGVTDWIAIVESAYPNLALGLGNYYLADSPNNVGFIFETRNRLTATSTKYISIRNAGVERASIGREGQFCQQIVSTTTPNATPISIDLSGVVTSTGNVFTLNADIAAKTATNSNVAAYKIAASGYRTSGNVLDLINGTTAYHSDETDNTWNVKFATSSEPNSAFQLNVTGTSTEPVYWYACVTFIRNSLPN